MEKKTKDIMDSTPVLHEPLQRLPVLLNTVLIQIGKTFREPLRENKTQMLAGYQRPAQQIIVQSNCRFQETLDALEVELLGAKSLLESDLNALHSKRAERERAAGLNRLKASNENPTLSDKLRAEIASGNTGKHSLALSGQPRVEGTDTTMIDAPVQETEVRQRVDPSESGVRHEQSAKKDSTRGGTQPSENKEAIIVASGKAQTGTPARHSTTTQEDQMQFTDVDFDSMFTDPTVSNSNDTLPFDLDLPANGTVPQNMLDDHPFEDLAANADFASTSNEDLNSLLPGLENYVNGETNHASLVDFTMIDLADASKSVDLSEAKKKQELAALVPKEGVVGLDSASVTDLPIESSFDDLFYGGSGDLNFDSGAMADEDNMGVPGEFDDDWFNLDTT